MVELIIINSAHDHAGDVFAATKGKCLEFISHIAMDIMITSKSSSFDDLIIGFGVKHNTHNTLPEYHQLTCKH